MSPHNDKVRFEKNIFAKPGNQGPVELQKQPVILIAERDDILRRRLKQAFLPCGFAVVESSDKTAILQNLPSSSRGPRYYRLS
jgi:hypothetical protein